MQCYSDFTKSGTIHDHSVFNNLVHDSLVSAQTRKKEADKKAEEDKKAREASFISRFLG